MVLKIFFKNSAMKIKNKPYLDKTTIQITKSVLDVYDRMVSRYGVTVAVCAGILLLDKLNPEDREKHIDSVNALCASDKSFYEEAEILHKSGVLKPLSESSTGASKVSVLRVSSVLDRIKNINGVTEDERAIIDLFQSEVKPKIEKMISSLKDTGKTEKTLLKNKISILKELGRNDDAAAVKQVIAAAEEYEAGLLKKKRGKTSKHA